MTTEARTGPPAPPAPPPPTGRPPLRRRRDGRILGGVAAGVADHLAVDVVIIRILFVVITVVTMPFGLIAYVLGWVFIPAAEPGTEAPARAPHGADGQRVGRDPAFWIGVALLVVGALWILGGPLAPSRLVPGLFGRDLLWPLVLIAFGLALWRASDRPGTAPAEAPYPTQTSSYRPPPAPAAADPTTETPVYAPQLESDPRTRPPDPSGARPPAAAPPAADAPADPGTRHLDDPTTRDDRATSDPATDDLAADAPTSEDPTTPMGSVPPASSRYDTPAGGATPPPAAPPTGPGGGQPPGWTPPPVPARRRSLLTRVTLGLALVTAGVLWMLTAMNVLAFGIGRIAAATLLVVGFGLLVGSVVGRGRWLILAGALLLPLVIVGELLRPYGFADFGRFDPRGPHGQIQEAPATTEELAEEYQLGAGTITLDLSALEATDAASTRVQVGAGEILVDLPDDAIVDVTARVGVGEILLGGQSTGGFGQHRSATIETGDGSQSLSIELQVGLGQVHVREPADSSSLQAPDAADSATAAAISTTVSDAVAALTTTTFAR